MLVVLRAHEEAKDYTAPGEADAGTEIIELSWTIKSPAELSPELKEPQEDNEDDEDIDEIRFKRIQAFNNQPRDDVRMQCERPE